MRLFVPRLLCLLALPITAAAAQAAATKPAPTIPYSTPAAGSDGWAVAGVE